MFIAPESLNDLVSIMTKREKLTTVGLATIGSVTSELTNGDAEFTGRGIVTRSTDTILDVVIFTDQAPVMLYCIRIDGLSIVAICKTSIPQYQ